MPSLRLKSMLGPLARPLVWLWHRPLHRTEGRFHFQVLGTEYGGWPVLDDSLSHNSVVYCFGVGTDISFDLALIERFGCTVEAFDPTPRCISWINEQSLPEGFRFHEVGLSNQKQVLRFFAPPQNKFVSYTISQRGDSPDVVDLPVESLDNLMEQLGHSKIDLLKMDIEGAEYSVIADMTNKGIAPEQLCIEFHHGMYGYTREDTRNAVALLKSAGYVVHYVSQSGREYGFHRIDSSKVGLVPFKDNA